MKFERTKDGQPLEDIFIGRKTFYALSGWVWSPLHYQSNHAGYMANLDSEWELRGHPGRMFFPN